MTADQWAKLKPGDKLRNKRSPHVLLEVLRRERNNNMLGVVLKSVGDHHHWINDEFHNSYQLELEQTKAF